MAPAYGVSTPQTVTEYGWSNTSPEDPYGEAYDGRAKSCPESVTALYAPKAPLAALLRGYDTAYAYQMLDGAPPFRDSGRAQRLACFGYVRTPRTDPTSWEPKAQFTAMRRYLSVVADPGPERDPEPLAVRIEGPPELRTHLLGRRDGTHLIALWQAVDLYRCEPRTNAGDHLEVESWSVRLTFDETRRLTLHRPSDPTFEDAGRRLPDAAQVTLDIGADLVLVAVF